MHPAIKSVTWTTTTPVYQDGRDFYRANMEEQHLASYPGADWGDDIEHAENARHWFVNTFCQLHSIVPEFVDINAQATK